MKKFLCRVAEEEEAPRLKELIDPDSDTIWQGVAPWWVVCLDNDRIIGCVQVIVSSPIGHIEFMGLEPSLTDMQKAYAIKTMVKFGLYQMYSNEVFHIRSTIPMGNKPWRNMMKKHFGDHLCDASQYAVRTKWAS